MAAAGSVLRASTPVDPGTAKPSDDPWVRWLSTPGELVALVDASGTVPLEVSADGLDLAGVRVMNGSAEVRSVDGRLHATVTASVDGPCLILFPTR